MNDLPAKLKVTKIMFLESVTIQQNANIGEAARMMLNKKFSGLP